MNRLRKTDYIIIAVVLALIALVAFMVTRGGETETGQGGNETTAVTVSGTPKTLTVKDYAGKRIGVQTGTVFDEMIKENIPDAEISYYNSYTDLLQALKANIIDGFAADEPMVKYMMTEDSAVDYLKDKMDDYSFGFAFSKDDKGAALCGEFSEYIKKIKSDGTLAEIDSVWFGSDESKKIIPDVSTLSGEKGKLSLALESANAPFVYIKDNEIVGFEVDVAFRFCKESGYGLELVDMNFDGIIPAVSSGKNDFGASTITITEERRESVNFSEPHYDGGSVLAVRASDLEGTAGAPTVNTAKTLTYSDYNGKKIGILTGTNMEAESFKYFPDSEYLYFDGYPNLNTALMNGTIDAYLGDEPALKSIHAEQPSIDYIKERLTNNKYSFAFRKNEESETKLRDQLNEFLTKCRADGTLAEIDSIWFGDDDGKKLVDMSGLTGENGTIHVVTTSTDEPFSYIKNGEHVGYDIDVTMRFCREYGYALEIGDVDFQARIPALASGKYEFTTSMNVTPEREEEVMFSDPVSDGGIVVAVRASDIEGTAYTAASSSEPSYTEYNGRRMGIKTGSSFEPITLEYFPDSEYMYFDSSSDLIAALQNDKIDGFLEDEPVAAMMHSSQSDINYLKKPVMDDDYHFLFQKNTERSNKLRTEFNELISELRSNGQLDVLKEKWLGSDESAKTVDTSGLTGENGEITVAVVPDGVPFSYTSNNKLVGYAVELTTLYARKYGYSIKYEQANLAGCIAGLTSNKYDMLAGSFSYTDERAQSMDYSDVIYNGGVMLAVRSADLKGSTASADDGTQAEQTVEDKSFFGSIKESFNKNFVREDRYKLILSGIGMTCMITVLSVVFGSVLAFLICLFRRADSLLAGKICDLYVKLLQGTPMVVLLMILYYVIFGKSGIAAMWVAVIGFSLNFGAYVSEILRSGIDSIDSGQREAALALGYSENQAFFRFIFPQAAVRQLPVYRGEIISLLKNTSIVGYIAIQDLTKMSDIIRSRTYEAFFPLIVTAVIYFILAWIISLVLKFVLKQIDPRSKKRGVKGVALK